MRIGIYASYLRAYGEGEKYICKIAEILSERNDVEFIVFEETDVTELKNEFNVDLSKVGFKRLRVFGLLKLLYLQKLARVNAVSKITKIYDLFINQEHFTIIPSCAKKSILICEVPPAQFKTIKIKMVNFLYQIKRVIDGFLYIKNLIKY